MTPAKMVVIINIQAMSEEYFTFKELEKMSLGQLHKIQDQWIPIYNSRIEEIEDETHPIYQGSH